jgi:methylphosphotriester-DNA--protein-cysteine methyltransferase
MVADNIRIVRTLNQQVPSHSGVAIASDVDLGIFRARLVIERVFGPGQFFAALEPQPPEAARRLVLESGQLVKRIARRCGFGSEETTRRSFLRLLAITPQDYRAPVQLLNGLPWVGVSNQASSVRSI